MVRRPIPPRAFSKRAGRIVRSSRLLLRASALEGRIRAPSPNIRVPSLDVQSPRPYLPGGYPTVDFNGTKIDPSPDYSLGQSKTTSQGTYLNYIHTFRPELLLELKAGFTRINSIQDRKST